MSDKPKLDIETANSVWAVVPLNPGPDFDYDLPAKKKAAEARIIAGEKPRPWYVRLKQKLFG